MQAFQTVRDLYRSSFDFRVYEPYFNKVFGVRITAFVQQYWLLIGKAFVVSLYYSTGMLYYTQVEGWALVDCIYFSTVTFSTVGYGFFHPSSDHARVFTVFYMFWGIGLILPLAGTFSEHVGKRIQKELLLILHNTKNKWIVENVNKGVISIVSIFVMFYVGIAFYTSNEEFTFVTALYFVSQTMTTVGYGDIELKHESSRLFGIFFIIASVLTLATALNEFGVIYGNLARRREILHINGDKLKALSHTGDGVDKNVFVLEMLVELGVIDREHDIAPLLEKFNSLDLDKTGVLSEAEIDKFVEEEVYVPGPSPPRSPPQSPSRKPMEHNQGASDSNSIAADDVVNPLQDEPQRQEPAMPAYRKVDSEDAFLEV